jgi:hypothetical protein
MSLSSIRLLKTETNKHKVLEIMRDRSSIPHQILHLQLNSNRRRIVLQNLATVIITTRTIDKHDRIRVLQPGRLPTMVDKRLVALLGLIVRTNGKATTPSDMSLQIE